MKIINNTKWTTKHLRDIAREVANQMLDANQRARLIVTFKPSRMYVSGEAWIVKPTDRRSKLRTYILMPNRYNVHHPRERVADAKHCVPLRASIANVLAHEYAHNAGRRGERSMRGKQSRLGWASVKRGEWDWAEEFPLELAEVVKNPRPSDADKLAKIEANMRNWETKIKRANTYLKKYRKQQRYYQRKMAAQGASK